MKRYKIIIHRVNTAKELIGLPKKYGVEIDVRHDTSSGRLYLNHDPGTGEYLDEYIRHFEHAFIVYNIKEAGIEQECIEIASKHGIPKENYFLLDVEFPFLYQVSRNKGIREIAVRYSESEPIEMAMEQKEYVDWVWIDTNTKLPIYEDTAKKLEGFKTCLVAPDRWGRPEDNAPYRKKIEEFNFPLTAVMTERRYASLWE